MTTTMRVMIMRVMIMIFMPLMTTITIMKRIGRMIGSMKRIEVVAL
jgi:hypothetical protein